jgi:hypothetical protein
MKNSDDEELPDPQALRRPVRWPLAAHPADPKRPHNDLIYTVDVVA